MDTIAPARLAEAWDKVGLLAGDPRRELSGPVVLTIDLTEEVLAEAVNLGASAIVAYHPPIFKPFERLTASSAQERIIRGAIEHRIALYSPHTALDAAAGGVTDWLCEGLAGGSGSRVGGDVRALSHAVEHRLTEEVKIVTFVPAEQLEHLRRALATAGAGIIGHYQVCSFAIEGSGTFLGDETTDPAVGEPGSMETVTEMRLEMVCSRRALPLAIDTLKQFHPYEEPAFDVYALEPKPTRAVGAGRRLVLDRGATVPELAERLRRHLGRARVQMAIPPGMENQAITHIGVVPGAGGSMLGVAASEQCQLFVTGEMRHHDILDAVQRGVSVLLAGHTNTERGYLPRLAERLAQAVPGLDCRLSAADRDPLRTLAE